MKEKSINNDKKTRQDVQASLHGVGEKIDPIAMKAVHDNIVQEVSRLNNKNANHKDLIINTRLDKGGIANDKGGVQKQADSLNKPLNQAYEMNVGNKAQKAVQKSATEVVRSEGNGTKPGNRR